MKIIFTGRRAGIVTRELVDFYFQEQRSEFKSSVGRQVVDHHRPSSHQPSMVKSRASRGEWLVLCLWNLSELSC